MPNTFTYYAVLFKHKLVEIFCKVIFHTCEKWFTICNAWPLLIFFPCCPNFTFVTKNLFLNSTAENRGKN